MGAHACGFNGFKTQKDVRFVARHNDHLELLYGRYAYEIEFNPPPPVENFTSRKRSYQPETVEAENEAKTSKLGNYSDEELENNEEKKARLFSNGVHSDQRTPNVGCSMHSGESNSDSNMSAKWESIDNGKLMIYTSSSVQHRSKVILTVSFV